MAQKPRTCIQILALLPPSSGTSARCFNSRRHHFSAGGGRTLFVYTGRQQLRAQQAPVSLAYGVTQGLRPLSLTRPRIKCPLRLSPSSRGLLCGWDAAQALGPTPPTVRAAARTRLPQEGKKDGLVGAQRPWSPQLPSRNYVSRLVLEASPARSYSRNNLGSNSGSATGGCVTLGHDKPTHSWLLTHKM